MKRVTSRICLHENREKVIEAHKDSKDVEVHTLYPRAVGPHPTGNFETLFTRNAFATFVPWLMWNRSFPTPPFLSPHTSGAGSQHLTSHSRVFHVCAWGRRLRPAEVGSVLIHPITPIQMPDHTVRALWLGEPLTLKTALLEQVDKATAAKGQSEEEAILSIVAH